MPSDHDHSFARVVCSSAEFNTRRGRLVPVKCRDCKTRGRGPAPFLNPPRAPDLTGSALVRVVSQETPTSSSPVRHDRLPGFSFRQDRCQGCKAGRADRYPSPYWYWRAPSRLGLVRCISTSPAATKARRRVRPDGRGRQHSSYELKIVKFGGLGGEQLGQACFFRKRSALSAMFNIERS